MKSCPTIILPH